jgi:LuxR family maltose regulon positive regulatory protein
MSPETVHADLASDSSQFGATSNTPILATKLYRPLVTPDMTPRDGLVQRLERNRLRPLTLISAPPGYGKTMLVSAWVEASGRPCAWISLDQADNDLRTFLAYLLAALKSVYPASGWRLEPMLKASVLPGVTNLVRALSFDLEQIETPYFVVFDDLHLIWDGQIYDLLSTYLRFPVRKAHLVLVSRVDPSLPIAAMRARGQVSEIRARDLRFNTDEATHLLSRLLARPVDAAVAADWVQKTEGWAAALRLVALSLRHRGAEDSLHGKVSGDSHYLQEYLVAEVLDELPPDLRDCMLKISILDRFCDTLCNALCWSGSETRETDLMRSIQEANLFLVPLDDKHEWFRFHHLFQKLLQQFLQTRLGIEAVADLHLRAVAWLEEHGFLDEALRHALAANDIDTAVQIVLKHRYDLMNNEQWHRLAGWLKMLSSDVIANDPALVTTRGCVGLFTGNDQEFLLAPVEAQRLLTVQSRDKETYEVVAGEISVLRAIADLVYGRPAMAIERASMGLELVPQQAQFIRSFTIGVKAFSMQSMGDLNQAVDLIKRAPTESVWLDHIRARLWFYLAVTYFLQGRLGQVITSSHECLRLSEEWHLSEVGGFGRYLLGASHYLRNQLTAAEDHLSVLHAGRELVQPSYYTSASIILVLAYRAQGRASEAERVMEEVRVYLQDKDNSFARAMFEAFQVELSLREGFLSQARQLSSGVQFDPRTPLWFFYVPQLVPSKLLLAEGLPDLALTQLRDLDMQMLSQHRHCVRLDVLVLQAVAYDALGEEAKAMEKLGEALTLAAAGGQIRNFLDLGQPMASLLARFRRRNEATSTAFASFLERIAAAFDQASPLTRREEEVLRFLASELPIQDIAGKLVISPATLHTHTKKIYRKLNAHSRFEAVQRARDMGLL